MVAGGRFLCFCRWSTTGRGKKPNLKIRTTYPSSNSRRECVCVCVRACVGGREVVSVFSIFDNAVGRTVTAIAFCAVVRPRIENNARTVDKYPANRLNERDEHAARYLYVS